MAVLATSVRCIPGGKAFWYAIADTSEGQMFVKVPLCSPTGGHESAWQEFIACRLARCIGLPALEPYAVEVEPALLSDDDRARTFWGFGNRFVATPFQLRLAPGRGYDELGDAGKALLYVFDNYLFYMDRARPSRPPSRQDCWLGDDGNPILLDWDVYPVPSRTGGPGMGVGLYPWEASKFLGVQLPATQIKNACDRAIVGLTNDAIRDAVSCASLEWDRVDQGAVAAWLLGRRDSLLAAFLAAETPPWCVG